MYSAIINTPTDCGEYHRLRSWAWHPRRSPLLITSSADNMEIWKSISVSQSDLYLRKEMDVLFISTLISFSIVNFLLCPRAFSILFRVIQTRRLLLLSLFVIKLLCVVYSRQKHIHPILWNTILCSQIITNESYSLKNTIIVSLCDQLIFKYLDF